MKRAKYRGAISRLFDYNELAELTFKLTVYIALALYIILVTGLLAPGPTALPALGILTLRMAFMVILLTLSVYVIREFRTTKVRAERRKTTPSKEARKVLHLLVALLATTVAFYALLLYY
ncbi:MAG: hypothetical protein QXH02_05920 [Desulfurococcaceae archaeon]